MELKISEIIPLEIKNKLLGLLCCEYSNTKRNRTLKYLYLYVDDKKSITTIEYLCGIEILYKLLNNECYLNSKCKELLIQYIRELKLNEKEEEKMSKKIKNKELLYELKFKEITVFSYPSSQYSFGINEEEISIIPSFNCTKCEFSINPSLPDGLILEKENGIIHGKVEKSFEKKEYEITCRNKLNQKIFKISLEFEDIKFSESQRSDGIEVLNNGEKMKMDLTKSAEYSVYHCYLDLKLENGIYHIKYKHTSNKQLILGLSTDNKCSGDIYNQTACYFVVKDRKSENICCSGEVGTVVNKNPNFCNCSSTYEIIVDMNKREFWISYHNSTPVLIVKDLYSPLYPYTVVRAFNYVELLSFSHQN